MRVLIADDEKHVSAVLAELVTSYGHEVVAMVGSGFDAVRAYHQHHPDVVLMDLMMARLNGATATRLIRSQDPAARIILLSGRASEEEVLARDCGAVAALQKPFRGERLNDLLNASAPASAR